MTQMKYARNTESKTLNPKRSQANASYKRLAKGRNPKTGKGHT